MRNKKVDSYKDIFMERKTFIRIDSSQFDYAKKLKCMLRSKISYITNWVTHIEDLKWSTSARLNH